MASLRDTINNSLGTGNKKLVRTASGQLVEQAVPISQLAGQQGMTAPPTTPGGAAALGATPDSAKMAGTPNQMQSALRQNTDQINTTQEAQADKRYRSTLTAEEQGRKEKAEKLAPLSETHAKVQSFVDAEVQRVATAGGTAGQTLAAGTLTATDPTKQAEVDAAVQKAATGDAQAIADLINLTNIKDPIQINAAVQAAVTTGLNEAGKAYATAIGDIGIENILPEGMTKDTLAGLLGFTDATQLDKMSIGDLDTLISNLGQTTAQTDAAANSALLGSAERAEMAERSKELSTSGAAAIDDQLLDLGTQLESADEVTFLGKKGTLSELLSDEGISNEVTALLNDKERFDKLPDTDPLKQFITQYKDVLTQAATGVEKAGKEYTAISDANKAALTFGNATLSPELSKELMGFDPSKPTAEKADPSKSTVLTWLRGQPADVMDSLVTEMNGNTSLAKELNGLNAGELSALRAPEGSGWRAFKQATDNRQRWRQLDPSNADAVLDFLFAGAPKYTDISKSIVDAKYGKLAGIQPDPTFALLDSDGDGRVDNWTDITKRIQAGLGPTAAQAAAGKTSVFQEGRPEPTLLPPETRAALNKLLPENDYSKLTSNYVANRIPSTSLADRKALLALPKTSPLYEKIRTGIAVQNRKAQEYIKERVSGLLAKGDKKAAMTLLENQASYSSKSLTEEGEANVTGSPNVFREWLGQINKGRKI